MFDYKSIIESANFYGRSKGFLPFEPRYKEICEWIKTLPEEYRLRMNSYTVVKKVLPDSPSHDLIIEYHHETGLVALGFCHKLQQPL